MFLKGAQPLEQGIRLVSSICIPQMSQQPGFAQVWINPYLPVKTVSTPV
jgi:hypothetical protein